MQGTNARDKAVLELIGKRGCTNLETLYRHFFPSLVACRDRMNSLVRRGFIHVMIVDVRKIAGMRIQEPIYYLDKKAKSFFNQAEWEMLQKRIPPFGQIDHMLKAGYIIDELAKCNEILSYATEISLRSNAFLAGHYGNLADLSITTKHGVTLIEVDSINYTGIRLSEKVKGLGDARTLWVAYSEARRETVRYACFLYPRITVVHFEDLARLTL